MSHFGRPSSRRVLVVVTVEDAGILQLPEWIGRFGVSDVFVLNPHGYSVQPVDDSRIGEIFLFTDPTGLDGLAQPSYLFRSQNELLRRSFRELLRWGRWDTLVIDGLKSIAPLIGNGGIDIPRTLATTIFHERPEDLEMISPPLRWYQLSDRLTRRRLKKWHQSIVTKSFEVIRNSESIQKPMFDGSEIST